MCGGWRHTGCTAGGRRLRPQRAVETRRALAQRAATRRVVVALASYKQQNDSKPHLSQPEFKHMYMVLPSRCAHTFKVQASNACIHAGLLNSGKADSPNAGAIPQVEAWSAV